MSLDKYLSVFPEFQNDLRNAGTSTKGMGLKNFKRAPSSVGSKKKINEKSIEHA